MEVLIDDGSQELLENDKASAILILIAVWLTINESGAVRIVTIAKCFRTHFHYNIIMISYELPLPYIFDHSVLFPYIHLFFTFDSYSLLLKLNII